MATATYPMFPIPVGGPLDPGPVTSAPLVHPEQD